MSPKENRRREKLDREASRQHAKSEQLAWRAIWDRCGMQGAEALAQARAAGHSLESFASERFSCLGCPFLLACVLDGNGLARIRFEEANEQAPETEQTI